MKDLFKHCNCVEALEESGKHVEFVGRDGYATSVSIDKTAEAMVAYEMNGVPIPRDHGHPTRAIIPGVAGARSVKWLQDINVLDEESSSFWQTHDYKIFPARYDGQTSLPNEEEISRTKIIQEMPVQSSPLSITNLPNQKSKRVCGYAIGSGGCPVDQVHVSADGGKTWKRARLQTDPEQHSWVLWEAFLPIENDNGILSRATDTRGHQQPIHIESIWNYRGLCNNAVNHQ